MAEIGNLIGSFGFPIVACMGLFYFITTSLKQLTATIKTLSESVDNNTKVTESILKYLSEKGGEIE